MSGLPEIFPHPLRECAEPFKKMEGKTIKKVEYGYEKPVTDRQEKDALILEFTDGTKVGIVLGSNTREFIANPERISLDLTPRWNN